EASLEDVRDGRIPPYRVADAARETMEADPKLALAMMEACPWPFEAPSAYGDVLSAQHDVLHARLLLRNGRREDAERLLEKHGDAWTQSAMRAIGEDQEAIYASKEPELALLLSLAVRDWWLIPRRRMAEARALHALGRVAEAREMALTL